MGKKLNLLTLPKVLRGSPSAVNISYIQPNHTLTQLMYNTIVVDTLIYLIQQKLFHTKTIKITKKLNIKALRDATETRYKVGVVDSSRRDEERGRQQNNGVLNFPNFSVHKDV